MGGACSTSGVMTIDEEHAPEALVVQNIAQTQLQQPDVSSMKKLTQLQQLDISSSEESRDTTTLEETSSTATPNQPMPSNSN
jgi:hypothetical protein